MKSIFKLIYLKMHIWLCLILSEPIKRVRNMTVLPGQLHTFCKSNKH